jgi:hypothetical protein
MYVALAAFVAVVQVALSPVTPTDSAHVTIEPNVPSENRHVVELAQVPTTPQMDGVFYGPEAPFSTASSTSGATTTSVTVSSSMRAQMDVFSGRPNPSWDLSPQEADQTRAILARLPERQPVIRSDNLGYRGVILQGDAIRDLGYTRISVGGGVAVAEGSQGTRYFSDSDRSLERQVFTTARGRIDATDYAAFKSIAFP